MAPYVAQVAQVVAFLQAPGTQKLYPYPAGETVNQHAMHTTNYLDAFIEVADDCKAEAGTAPPEKQAKTVAQIQYDLISRNPYTYTSDEVIFAAYSEKNQIDPSRYEAERIAFFSKGQACLRASPLGKTYGWGIHFDGASRVAIYGRGSREYRKFAADKSLKHLKAMKSAR